MDKLTNIDPKKTTITLGLAFAAVLFVWGASAAWTHVEAQNKLNAAEIAALEAKQEADKTEVLSRIDTLSDELRTTREAVIELNALLKAGKLQSTTIINETPDNHTTNVTVKDEQPGRQEPPERQEQPNQVGLTEIPFWPF